MKGFQELGFKPEVKPLTFFQDDYGFKEELGEEESGSDEDTEGSEEEGADKGEE